MFSFTCDGENSTADHSSDFDDIEIEAVNSPTPDTKEARLVSYSRMSMVLVLLVSATSVCYLTYRFVKDEEKEDFRLQFHFDAQQLIQTAKERIEKKEQVMSVFRDLLSSSADRDGAVWPFYTQPDYETFGTEFRKLAGIELMVFSPLVTNDQWKDWNVYSKRNQRAVVGETGISITPIIHSEPTTAFTFDETLDLYSPVWQVSPVPSDTTIFNYNLLGHTYVQALSKFVGSSRGVAVSGTMDVKAVMGASAPRGDDPQSIMMVPLTDSLNKQGSRVVGHLLSVVRWGSFFKDVLLDESVGVYAVLRESCGQTYTFLVVGETETFVGTGESKHDVSFEDLVIESKLANYVSQDGIQCHYTLSVYPARSFKQTHSTNRPLIIVAGVLSVFAFTSLIFILYDRLVQRRQENMVKRANRTTAILSSLFPESVRNQLYGHEQPQPRKSFVEKVRFGRNSAPSQPTRKSTLDDLENDEGFLATKPIAELFPNATVLFADVAGFTAWSSVRDPPQVFLLLETIYNAFDKLAKQRGVFKVETIGDCYVAVVGLPDPCEDHAFVVAKFARDCLDKFNELAHKLEVSLGPDTGDLKMRFGLHSGPVTGGVLRGDRARFQLFGDTVNTASRMESTGMKNRIQISQQTADLIVLAGQPDWLEERADTVEVKGKGPLRTYWLLPHIDLSTPSLDKSTRSIPDERSFMFPRASSSHLSEVSKLPDKIKRMVDWTCDMLLPLLKRVVATRQLSSSLRTDYDESVLEAMENETSNVQTCLDEVAEIISLPQFNCAAYEASIEKVELSQDISNQLHEFLAIIASMYRSNPFHNFEHASHVTMSTVKLLSRIVAPNKGDERILHQDLHDSTYGITSDPLTQFAVVFSALIHDVDHRGVPNSVLQEEDTALSAVYQNQSVAEQNSVDVAWRLLMDPDFDELRKAIYTTENEMKRFRQLVVNSVMATDIFDKELGELRRKRWERAFDGERSFTESDVSVNRKATIVIEHLIQASDVSHTMQHWHVYTKWNERLYEEMYTAYTTGRTSTDPTDGWYEGELKFLENYIMPLAKKLKDCGVFGVSCDEILNYAQQNHAEWQVKGKDFVANLRRKYSISPQLLATSEVAKRVHRADSNC